jgi:hypothetical protein
MLIDVVKTRLTPVEAELTLIALPDDLEMQGVELVGKVVGPRNAYAETIEIPYAVKPLPRENELVRSRVHIPEPLLWTPARPFLYEGRLELRRGEEILAAARPAIALKELRLHEKKGVRLNGERLELVGYFGRGLTEEEARRLHANGVNVLVVPIKEANLPIWDLANRLGFLVIGLVDPEDEPMLWEANGTLSRQPCTFGWLLPQDLIGHPQRWHNAVSLLHGQRTDLFVGVKVERLPLGALPGHVVFVVGETELLERLGAQGLPMLGLLPRGGEAKRPETQSAWLGWLRRTV